MYILGIESTAHTFGVGIVDETGKELANVRDMFTSEKEGINPTLAKEHHLACKDRVIADALSAAGLKASDIDLVSYSMAPGLPPCLLVGRDAAVAFARDNKLPLVGVNHCIAHLEIGKLLGQSDDPVLLYASGANTQVIAFEQGKYRVFGETLDQGIGNAIDHFARHMGLGFPGGPKIEKLAADGKQLLDLPYSIKGMDVSFSGIITKLKRMYDSGEYSQADICFSLQEVCFAILTETAERALAHIGKNELVLGGGVACNSRLQEMCRIMCEERGARFFCPPRGVLVDNGVMIAWLGYLSRENASQEYDSFDIDPSERTDDVVVDW